VAGLLFLCPDSAARGPMAEAIARHLAPGLPVWSAALRPGHVRREARRTLRAAGVDDSGLRARSLLEVDLEGVQVAVLLAPDHELPRVPAGLQIVRHPLPDPSSAPPSEAEDAYADARDALLRLIPKLLGAGAPRRLG
jgi:protein-tyrosine-phosphatase